MGTISHVVRASSLGISFLLASCQFQTEPSAAKVARPVPPMIKTTSRFAVPVLMYHRITELTELEQKSPLTRDLSVAPKDFEEQVAYLYAQGFALLSVYDVQEALLKGSELPERAVAITFDDGYRDNFEKAFPILHKYGASATIFLVQKTFGDSRHLTEGQVRIMRTDGVRYGSHTATHADLPSLDDGRLDQELVESKGFFEGMLREGVTALAYPAGKFDDRVVRHVEAAGYLSAWKKGGGPVRPGDDPYRLPRVRVNGGTTLEDFKRKVWSGVFAIRMHDATIPRLSPRERPLRRIRTG